MEYVHGKPGSLWCVPSSPSVGPDAWCRDACAARCTEYIKAMQRGIQAEGTIASDFYLVGRVDVNRRLCVHF